MSTTTAGVIFIVSLVAALVVAYKPFGDYMYRVVTGTKHTRVERGIYRPIGVNPDGEQSWGVYARSVLAFSVVVGSCSCTRCSGCRRTCPILGHELHRASVRRCPGTPRSAS